MSDDAVCPLASSVGLAFAADTKANDRALTLAGSSAPKLGRVWRGSPWEST